MNRYFKVIRDYDGGIADIVFATDENQAWWEANKQWTFGFRIVECSRDEHHTWTVINWDAVDSLEREMVTMDSF